MKPLKPLVGWAVVDISPGTSTLHGILGVREELPAGTYFGAVFFHRRFAKELSKKWGPSARVVKVRLSDMRQMEAKAC